MSRVFNVLPEKYSRMIYISVANRSHTNSHDIVHHSHNIAVLILLILGIQLFPLSPLQDQFHFQSVSVVNHLFDHSTSTISQNQVLFNSFFLWVILEYIAGKIYIYQYKYTTVKRLAHG